MFYFEPAELISVYSWCLRSTCLSSRFTNGQYSNQWRHWVWAGERRGGPPWVTPSRGWHPNKITFFVAEFIKDTG